MFVHAAGMGGLASASCKYEAKHAGRMLWRALRLLTAPEGAW